MNLATGRGVSMDELAMMAMATAGYDAPIQHLTAKPAGVRCRVGDPTLLHRYYRPRVTLEDGVRRAFAG